MIRKIYDNWAGTTLGLSVNFLVFAASLALPASIGAVCIVYGWAVLAVNFYGIRRGWNYE